MPKTDGMTPERTLRRFIPEKEATISHHKNSYEMTVSFQKARTVFWSKANDRRIANKLKDEYFNKSLSVLSIFCRHFSLPIPVNTSTLYSRRLTPRKSTFFSLSENPSNYLSDIRSPKFVNDHRLAQIPLLLLGVNGL